MKRIILILVTIFSFLNPGLSQTYKWTYVSNLPEPRPIANSLCAVDYNILWIACSSQNGVARIYRSVDGGLNWTIKNQGLPAVNGYGIFALDSVNCWFGTDQASIYHTSNGGLNWTNQITVPGSFSNGITFFTPNYGVWFADPTSSNGQPFQLRVTTNAGNNWNLIPSAPISSSENGVLNSWDFTDSNHFWLGTHNTIAYTNFARIFKTNSGYYGNWNNTQVAVTGTSDGCWIKAIAFVNSMNGIIGTSNGDILNTTDGGLTFSTCSLPPGLYIPYKLMTAYGLKDGSNIIRIAVEMNYMTTIFKTSNLGLSWVNEPLDTPVIGNPISHMKFVDATHGFAILQSLYNSGLFKYGLVTGITPVSGNVPADFSLKQNYPNPFNPTTTIEFDLPKASNVSLKIYNSLGKEVETLLSENMIAGNYKVSFDASKLSSGIYFYTLSTGSFRQTKTMSLVK